MATKSKLHKPKTVADSFKNRFEPFKLLSPEGELLGEAPELGNEQLLTMYRWMVEARIFDERAVNLQRQGRLGTFAPLSGQEAAQVGSAFALKKSDWLFPSYREHAACAVHGQPWLSILTYWGGNEEGSRMPADVNVFPVSIPIGTQIIHAVGMSWGAKLQGKQDAAIAYFGDGGTSEGDFHEGLNFAGVYNTATVFFCQNNFYAISLPRSAQTAAQSIAQKAIAYGIEGIQVDGNDVLAVYAVTQEALERGRAGQGPTLIEAQTYRYGPHTTADDPTRYRKSEEVEEWKVRDPILRLRRFLLNKGIWTEAKDEALWEEARARIGKVVDAYEALPQRPVDDIFKYVFAEMPWHLREQLDELKRFIAEYGDPNEGHH